jgi:hypothetical protein
MPVKKEKKARGKIELVVGVKNTVSKEGTWGETGDYIEEEEEEWEEESDARKETRESRFTAKGSTFSGSVAVWRSTGADLRDSACM